MPLPCRSRAGSGPPPSGSSAATGPTARTAPQRRATSARSQAHNQRIRMLIIRRRVSAPASGSAPRRRGPCRRPAACAARHVSAIGTSSHHAFRARDESAPVVRGKEVTLSGRQRRRQVCRQPSTHRPAQRLDALHPRVAAAQKRHDASAAARCQLSTRHARAMMRCDAQRWDAHVGEHEAFVAEQGAVVHHDGGGVLGSCGVSGAVAARAERDAERGEERLVVLLRLRLDLAQQVLLRPRRASARRGAARSSGV